jgi:hypothetical protein
MFFSWTFSHPVDPDRPSLVGPDGKLFSPSEAERHAWADRGIDVFALEFADFVSGNLRTYIDDYVTRPDATTLFYEDMVADPQSWLSAMLLGLGLSTDDAEFFAQCTLEDLSDHFAPVIENPMRHRRQITPGDHARKLQPRTIAKLDRIFEFYFDFVSRAKPQPPRAASDAA